MNACIISALRTDEQILGLPSNGCARAAMKILIQARYVLEGQVFLPCDVRMEVHNGGYYL